MLAPELGRGYAATRVHQLSRRRGGRGRKFRFIFGRKVSSAFKLANKSFFEGCRILNAYRYFFCNIRAIDGGGGLAGWLLQQLLSAGGV